MGADYKGWLEIALLLVMCAFMAWALFALYEDDR